MKIQFKKFLALSKRKPLTVFITLLALVVGLIYFGNLLRKPTDTAGTKTVPKKVQVYSIGSAPQVNFQAQIEKSGVIQIVSAASGIVSRLNIVEGSKVSKGKLLVSLSSNYSGGNALTVARQLAEKQNQIVEDSYPSQKDLIARQREIANQSQGNFEKLRDIIGQSIDDTQSLLNANNDIISSLSTNIQNLSVDPVGNASLILSSKQLLSQFQSANLQLNSALRNAQYQNDANNPPSKLSDEQKSLTLKQLDVQDHLLDLNREISGLQLKLARINEALMYPSAPFDGTVEKISVRVGQQVNAGTPLLQFSAANNQSIKATIYLPKNLADNVSRVDTTSFAVNNRPIRLTPDYLSHEAVNGNLYAVTYILPPDTYPSVTDKGYIEALVPIGYPDTGSAIPYVPLDAVYQTQDQAYVFLIKNNQAISKQVELGEVVGSFVKINSGLSRGDVVIKDRNVLDGDSVVW